jgi:hypothetical protein
MSLDVKNNQGVLNFERFENEFFEEFAEKSI